MTKHALTSLCVSRYKDVHVTEEIKKAEYSYHNNYKLSRK